MRSARARPVVRPPRRATAGNAATYIAVTIAYAGPMPMSATPAVPASAPATRAVSEVVREMPSAHEQHAGLHGLADEHVAHHHVRRAHQAGDGGDREHVPGLERFAQREQREHRGEHARRRRA